MGSRKYAMVKRAMPIREPREGDDLSWEDEDKREQGVERV